MDIYGKVELWKNVEDVIPTSSFIYLMYSWQKSYDLQAN